MTTTTPIILSNGTPLDGNFAVIALETRKEANRIPTAYLTLLDGAVAEQTFPVSEDLNLALGNAIEIRLREDGGARSDATTLFKGIIVGQTIEASADGARTVVTLKDAAIRLTHGRKHAVYRNQSDSDIYRQLVNTAGLSGGTFDRTTGTHDALVQYNATDWDFLLLRAQINGQIVAVDDGILSVRRPDLVPAAAETYTFGDNIIALALQLDGREQADGVVSLAWDAKTQKLTKAVKAKPFALQQGNVQPAAAAAALGLAAAPRLVDPVALDQAALQAWSDGEQAYRALALLRGTITIAGDAAIKPLQTVELAGLGARFNGKALVSGVRHTVDAAHGWRTVVQFGLPPDRFAERLDIAAPPAAGHLPPVQGIQIGVVAPYEQAPYGQQWIRVTLPALPAAAGPIWARHVVPDGGPGRGIVFLPEPGDEVIVGFLNDDPRQAVVLGSLFNSAGDLPGQLPSPSADNVGKGIVTKGGTALIFEDNAGKPSLRITTAAGNAITLDDDGKQLALTDQHGNRITLDQGGITIKSASSLNIEASGAIKIKGSTVDIS